MEFGKMIRDAREKQRLSQADLARAVGLHRSTILSYEKHGKMPKDARTWKELERVLELDLGEFFRESEDLDRFMGLCSRNYGLHQHELGLDFETLREDLHSESERQLQHWMMILEFILATDNLTERCESEIKRTCEEIQEIRKRRQKRAWMRSHRQAKFN